jgi:hypothetical protein
VCRFFLPGRKVQLEEGTGRILLGKNTGEKAVMLQLTRFQYFGIRISLDSLVCTYIFDHTYTQFRLVSNSTYAGHSGTMLSFNSGRNCNVISKNALQKRVTLASLALPPVLRP